MSLTKKIIVGLLVVIVPFGIPLDMAFVAAHHVNLRAA